MSDSPLRHAEGGNRKAVIRGVYVEDLPWRPWPVDGDWEPESNGAGSGAGVGGKRGWVVDANGWPVVREVGFVRKERV